MTSREILPRRLGGQPAPIVWREIKSLTADLFRCDLCGEQADTIHLLPWCGAECEYALFACPRHDPGGYWFRVAEWIDERDRWERHLEEKIDPRRCDPAHPGGLYVLMQRVHELTYVVVGGDDMTGLVVDDLARRLDVDVDVLRAVLDNELERGRVVCDAEGGYVLVVETFDAKTLIALRTIDERDVALESRESSTT